MRFSKTNKKCHRGSKKTLTFLSISNVIERIGSFLEKLAFYFKPSEVCFNRGHVSCCNRRHVLAHVPAHVLAQVPAHVPAHVQAHVLGRPLPKSDGGLLKIRPRGNSKPVQLVPPVPAGRTSRPQRKTYTTRTLRWSLSGKTRRKSTGGSQLVVGKTRIYSVNPAWHATSTVNCEA